MAKQICLTRERALLCESIKRLPQKQGCPLTVVDFLRLPFRFSRDLRLGFCGSLVIQVCQDHPAAAFQSQSTIMHIGGKVFQRAKKKRTKPSFLTIGACVRTSLDQISKEALDQIPCILCATSLPT
jgi:hypothetical protein